MSYEVILTHKQLTLAKEVLEKTLSDIKQEKRNFYDTLSKLPVELEPKDIDTAFEERADLLKRIIYAIEVAESNRKNKWNPHEWVPKDTSPEDVLTLFVAPTNDAMKNPALTSAWNVDPNGKF